MYQQTDQTENGVYTVTDTGSGATNWVLTRATDADSYVFDSPNGWSEGSTFFVQEGATGAGETYICNTVGTITFGTTNITFVQVSSAQIYSAGAGLDLTGTQFSVETNGITDSMLRQSAGLSVIGRSTNSTGNVADITAASDHQVLRRSGTAVAFGAIDLAQGNSITGTLPVASGGTGQTSYTNGELLIGNTTGNTLTKATLTAGTGITVTNGTGSITLAIGQAVATNSNVQFGSLGVGTAASGTTGEIRATNNITAYYSDDRLKTKLGNIDGALDKVCTLNGFYYEANETAQALGYGIKKEVGVSAQEVQAIMPEVVAPAPIDDKYLTVRYERLVPLLVEAIKELRAEIKLLKGE